MSLVELMVGMLIGLIGIIIMGHLYVTNEQYKRSTTGSGTAQVNGAIALYTLERDIRMAGYGINHSAALGCSCAGAGCSPIQYFFNGTYSYPPAASPSGALPPMVMAPVTITDSTGAPDSITILYGGDAERAMPTTLTETMPSASAEFKVDGTAGFEENNLVIVADGASCMLSQITQVQGSAAKLQHNPGVSAPWNPVGGTSALPAFSSGASVFNLGTPTWRTYSINTATGLLRKLQVLDVLGAPAAAVPVQLVDDIVDLQAEYGKDDGGGGGVANDGVVDTWNTVQPTNSAQWQQVLAVRLAVLARSPNYEKPGTAGGACEATTATSPLGWSSAAANGVLTVPGGLPSCYKHRVFEVVIPLRNMIWRPA
jgi:type IV pilus assembly protein PilW